MKIYVVYGKNNLLHASGPVGVSKTLDGAIKIQKEKEWIMDESKIEELELEESK